MCGCVGREGGFIEEEGLDGGDKKEIDGGEGKIELGGEAGGSLLSSSYTHYGSPSMSVAAWEALLNDAIRTSTG